MKNVITSAVNFIFLALISIVFCSRAFSDAAIEDVALFIEKGYANGDKIRIDCKDRSSSRCKISMKIDGIFKKVSMNFARSGLRPTFERVSMNGIGHPFVASIAYDFDCREIDLVKIDPRAVAVFCSVSLVIEEDGEVKWGAIQVLPVEKEIVRPVNSLP